MPDILDAMFSMASVVVMSCKLICRVRAVKRSLNPPIEFSNLVVKVVTDDKMSSVVVLS